MAMGVEMMLPSNIDASSPRHTVAGEARSLTERFQSEFTTMDSMRSTVGPPAQESLQHAEETRSTRMLRVPTDDRYNDDMQDHQKFSMLEPDQAKSPPSRSMQLCVAIAGYGDSRSSRIWLSVQILGYFTLIVGKLLRNAVEGRDDAVERTEVVMSWCNTFAHSCYDVVAVIALLYGKKANHLVAELKEPPLGAITLLIIASTITAIQTLYFLSLVYEQGSHTLSTLNLCLSSSLISTAPGIICGFLPIWTAQFSAVGLLDGLIGRLESPTALIDWQLAMPKVYGEVHTSVNLICRDLSKTVAAYCIAVACCAIANSLSLWVHTGLADGLRNILHTCLATSYLTAFLVFLRFLTRISSRFTLVLERMALHLGSCGRLHTQGLLLLNTYMVKNPVCWEVYLTKSSIVRIKGGSGTIMSLFLIANAAVRVLLGMRKMKE
eukprot:NODE_6174_length_1698_cov_8.918523.p1 GENE.NODE_6174_length_1698_cov_8.918523~~NODE_6174_length_1698_cov_8.918523.p1  ORF type:complete len:437 (+),score=116.35 NODE_6174_length_1698_cov_8.918523:229-1539(+)